MKLKSLLLFLVLFTGISTAPAEILYTSGDFSDWTYDANQWTVSNNSLTPKAGTGGLPAYKTTGDDAWKNSVTTVKVDVNWQETLNPMILSRVTDSGNFYMYRITRNGETTANAQLYVFSNNTATELTPSVNLTTIPSNTTLYYRLTTYDLGTTTWLVGETSYDADFSTLQNRMKRSTTTQLTGNSVGVRSYNNRELATYSNYTVSTLNAWTNAAGGNWADTANWSGGVVPNAAGETADFSLVDPTDAATVTLSDTRTVGRVIFGDTSGNTAWTLSGGTLNMNSGDAGSKAVITVESGSSATIKSKLTSASDIAVNGGGTLNLDRDAGNSLTGDWYVSGGAILSTNNQNGSNTRQASDPVFGSGKIYLNGGKLKTVSNTVHKSGGSDYDIKISNDLVVTGNCELTSNANTEMFILGNISGSGNLKESVTYSLRLYGDNSAYTGNWEITGDWVWTMNGSATKGSTWAGDGDYSFGSGQIEIKGGGLATTQANDAYVWNNMKISGTTNLIKNGKTATLTGNFTGSGTLNLTSTSTPTINFRGDNSAFTGAINISGCTVTTDNTSAEKVNGGDSRLGQGLITISGSSTTSTATPPVTTYYYGALKAAAETTYVHNDIKLNKVGAGFDATKFKPFLVDSGKTLVLTGKLTGDADVYKTDAGTLTLNGDGKDFTGDWHISGGKVVTNNTNASAATVSGKKADQRFGSGKIYVNNATIGTPTGSTKYIHNPLEITGTLTVQLFSELYLTGDLTGDGTIKNSGGYTFGLRGNNSEFTGNFIISGDYINTDNSTKSTDGKDPRFGQGTLFFNGTGISGTNGQTRYVANNISILNGQSGNLWRGDFHLTGVLTANGSLGSRVAGTGDVATLFIENKLQGVSSLNLPTTIRDGGVLSPGYTGVVDSTGNAVTDQPIGKLTFTKGLTLDPGALLNLDVKSATEFDQIAVSETELDLTGTTINLNFMEGFDPAGVNLEDVMQFAGSTTKLTGLESATLNYDVSQLPADSQWMRFRLTSTGIEVVNSNYIPEPATWALLILGGLLLLGVNSEGRRPRRPR